MCGSNKYTNISNTYVSTTSKQKYMYNPTEIVFPFGGAEKILDVGIDLELFFVLTNGGLYYMGYSTNYEQYGIKLSFTAKWINFPSSNINV